MHRRRPLLTGSDVELYGTFARRVLAGEVPYVDFDASYPPLSLVAFMLPGLLGGGDPPSVRTYRLLFGLLREYRPRAPGGPRRSPREGRGFAAGAG